MKKIFINQLLKEISDNYKDTCEKRSQFFPDQLNSVIKYSKIIFDYRFFLTKCLSLLLESKNKKFKYIIVGTRYKQIPLSYLKNETLLIVSNFAELKFAIFNSFHFLYFGYFNKYFHTSVFFKTKYNFESELKKCINIFSPKKKQYIISFSDTKPIDFMLRIISKNLSNQCFTICIQHGLMVDGNYKPGYFEEGKFSDFFLSFSHEQSKIAKKFINKSSKIFCLGPSWNNTLPSINEKNPEIILVGHGGFNIDKKEAYNYFKIFKFISKKLDSYSIQYSYRAHPTSVSDEELAYFNPLNTLSKNNLLFRKPRIFIGFISTLLFEAYTAGHTVVTIEDIYKKFKKPFESDYHYDLKNIEKLCKLLIQIETLNKIKRDYYYEIPVNKRLNDVLSEIENL